MGLAWGGSSSVATDFSTFEIFSGLLDQRAEQSSECRRVRVRVVHGASQQCVACAVVVCAAAVTAAAEESGSDSPARPLSVSAPLLSAARCSSPSDQRLQCKNGLTDEKSAGDAFAN